MITKRALIEEIESINDIKNLELVHQLILQIKQQNHKKTALRPNVLGAFNESLNEFDDLYRELAK
jgi:hypothetical protein